MPDFTMPEFVAPTPLADGRAWTAAYESYDQHYDEAHYRLSLVEVDGVVRERSVAVNLSWAGDDWSGPKFVEGMRQELHALALEAAGRPDRGKHTLPAVSPSFLTPTPLPDGRAWTATPWFYDGYSGTTYYLLSMRDPSGAVSDRRVWVDVSWVRDEWRPELVDRVRDTLHALALEKSP